MTDHVPHFSRVADATEAINPVTGRSIYFGMRPWRCDDRFQDWLKALTFFDGVSVQYRLLNRLWKCSRSEPGEEPKDDYFRLGRGEVMFYVERHRSGMMRNGALDTYPYDQNELRRVAEEDGLRMRVWRHQRALEMEAKEGKVDDILRDSVFSSAKPQSGGRSG